MTREQRLIGRVWSMKDVAGGYTLNVTIDNKVADAMPNLRPGKWLELRECDAPPWSD